MQRMPMPGRIVTAALSLPCRGCIRHGRLLRNVIVVVSLNQALRHVKHCVEVSISGNLIHRVLEIISFARSLLLENVSDLASLEAHALVPRLSSLSFTRGLPAGCSRCIPVRRLGAVDGDDGRLQRSQEQATTYVVCRQIRRRCRRCFWIDQISSGRAMQIRGAGETR